MREAGEVVVTVVFFGAQAEECPHETRRVLQSSESDALAVACGCGVINHFDEARKSEKEDA